MLPDELARSNCPLGAICYVLPSLLGTLSAILNQSINSVFITKTAALNSNYHMGFWNY